MKEPEVFVKRRLVDMRVDGEYIDVIKRSDRIELLTQVLDEYGDDFAIHIVEQELPVNPKFLPEMYHDSTDDMIILQIKGYVYPIAQNVEKVGHEV